MQQRTTIRLDEHLLIQVKEYAVSHGKTFTAVVEEALRDHLTPPTLARTAKKQRVRLPVSKSKGGFAPGIKTWDDAKRVLEREEVENFRRILRDDAAPGR